jgi:hypothetical protein
MSDRTRIKPIDADWTIEMTDEIAEFLVSPNVVEKYRNLKTCSSARQNNNE